MSSIETDEAANTSLLRPSLSLPQSQISQDKQHYDDDADDIENISRHDRSSLVVDFLQAIHGNSYLEWSAANHSQAHPHCNRYYLEQSICHEGSLETECELAVEGGRPVEIKVKNEFSKKLRRD